ncbi:TetR/AcrR family transcriptional regulator [Nocardia asiatica]|uniref:TetR/AcrR family transcriptional regulator n=1 Tax=Nocardia asiatica TaxID=209252 RepID=UPI003EE0E1B0
MARPRRPLLTRDRIIETALALVDAEGLAAVSTRRLATELGVQGPSLYNHVRTKDDLMMPWSTRYSARSTSRCSTDSRPGTRTGAQH